MKKGSLNYPVHYEKSDTSGEKPYEEFFTVSEAVDMKRFKALGVITDKKICDRERLNMLLARLETVFTEGEIAKSEVVSILSEYLPNFSHIETGKSLDSKM